MRAGKHTLQSRRLGQLKIQVGGKVSVGVPAHCLAHEALGDPEVFGKGRDVREAIRHCLIQLIGGNEAAHRPLIRFILMLGYQIIGAAPLCTRFPFYKRYGKTCRR